MPESWLLVCYHIEGVEFKEGKVKLLNHTAGRISKP